MRPRWLLASLILAAALPAMAEEPESPTTKDITKLKHIEEQIDQILQVQQQLQQRFDELTEELRIVKVRTSR